MKFNLIETKEILDFEKELKIELVVNERSKTYNLPKYYVSFENAEVMENGMLCGCSGNGNTIDEALLDYCKEIETKRMALFAYTDKRYEVVCPKLVHTKKARTIVLFFVFEALL